MTRRTLAHWHAELAEAPATPNQTGRLHLEFERLGYGPADRAARLKAAADYLGIDPIGSFTNLRQGQAGQLVRALAPYRTRAGLEAGTRLTSPPHEPPGRGPDYRRKLAALILRAMIIQAMREAARNQRIPDTMV